MDLVRSFIAIPLPQTLRKQISAVQHNLRQQLPELRTGAPDTLHLTLKFLGEQSEEQLAKIGRFMLSIAVGESPFLLNLTELGTFPGGKRPRVLWLGINPLEPLVSLQKKLSTGLVQLGVPKEQTPYRPHLTLGRFRQPPVSTEVLDTQKNTDFEPLSVDSMVLYSSRLTSQGAVHQPLKVAKFKSH